MNTLNPRELPGFLKKSFKMAYGGGEIWFEHLDGIYENTALVLEKLSADIPTLRRPSYPSAVSVVLDETAVTEEIISLLTDALTTDGKIFTRVAFVGADRKAARLIKHSLSSHAPSFAYAFFDDLEKSKAWLVSE